LHRSAEGLGNRARGVPLEYDCAGANIGRARAGHLGKRTPHGPGEEWPTRVDLHLRDGLTEADIDAWTPSACLLFSNGCGLEIAFQDGRMVGVRGRAEDRVNPGRLAPA
jgi:hypothetical protein